MELLPAMGFGWLNGWVLVVAFAAYFAVLVKRLPAATRAWLFDTRGWTRAQRILSGGSKVFVLACLVLFVVTPLKLDRPVFVAGVLLYAVGLFVLTAALREYRNGAADEPATRGVYGRSRNPQVLAIGVVFIGIVPRDRLRHGPHAVHGVGRSLSLPDPGRGAGVSREVRTLV